MRDILGKLEQYKANFDTTGIFSDFDGTLSKIAPTPADAVIDPRVRESLGKLAEKFAIIGIISGRDSSNAKKIIRLESLIYIGNHGLEWVEGSKQHYAPEALKFLDIMSNLADGLSESLLVKGLLIEKKKLGIAIHYRKVEDKNTAKALIEKAVKPLTEAYPLRVIEGKCVVEIKPDLPVNKGNALQSFALQRGIERAVYLGDDLTDVDAFKALRTLREQGSLETVSIGVISEESPPIIADESDYVVEGVESVATLIEWLAGEDD